MKANLPVDALCSIDYDRGGQTVRGELNGTSDLTTENTLHVTRWKNSDQIEVWTSRGQSIVLKASDFRKFIDAVFQDAPTEGGSR